MGASVGSPCSSYHQTLTGPPARRGDTLVPLHDGTATGAAFLAWGLQRSPLQRTVGTNTSSSRGMRTHMQVPTRRPRRGVAIIKARSRMSLGSSTSSHTFTRKIIKVQQHVRTHGREAVRVSIRFNAAMPRTKRGRIQERRSEAILVRERGLISFIVFRVRDASL